MSRIVDPMDALVTFEPALRRGEIRVQSCETDANLYVCLDHPNREPRYTFCRIENDQVTAIAIIVMADPNKGRPCFQVGYAVPPKLRGQGRAADIAAAAVRDLEAGLTRNGVESFFLEAVVGVSNVASLKVAEKLFDGQQPKSIEDEHSGEAALQFMMVRPA